MITAVEAQASHDPRLIERLCAAGLLQEGCQGLETTVSWQDGMLDALRDRASDPVAVLLRDSVAARFPGAAAAEVGSMARIMLLVEAREAGVVPS